jgi:hypothetical protein
MVAIEVVLSQKENPHYLVSSGVLTVSTTPFAYAQDDDITRALITEQSRLQQVTRQ